MFESLSEFTVKRHQYIHTLIVPGALLNQKRHLTITDGVSMGFTYMGSSRGRCPHTPGRGCKSLVGFGV